MLNSPARAGILLLLATLTAACETLVPVQASCPPPPPVPQILAEPASTGPSLSERWNALMQSVQESLRKATKPE